MFGSSIRHQSRQRAGKVCKHVYLPPKGWEGVILGHKVTGDPG